MMYEPIKIKTKQLILLLLFFLMACTQQAVQDKSLYDDLGGKQGIDLLTEKFLWHVLEDDRIVQRFVKSDIRRFQKMFSELICELSGGPCEYSGDNMKLTHAGHDISEAEFNAVVESLLNAMEELNLSVSAQNRLIARLAPMHKDIVSR